MTEEPPWTDLRPRLLTASGLASMLGISRQHVSHLQHNNKLPTPVAFVNGRPAWLPDQFASGSGRYRLFVVEFLDTDNEKSREEEPRCETP